MIRGARFSRKSRRSCGATRVTVAVATAEGRNARDAAFPAKPIRDGHLRGLRLVWARSFGMTKPRSPKPSRTLPQMTVAPAYHGSEAPYGREPTIEELSGYMKPLRLPGTYPALIQRMSQPADSTGWQQTPAAAIWGEDDRRVPLSVGRRLQDLVPELPLHVMPGAGHNPMETHPLAFQELLAGILIGPGADPPAAAGPSPSILDPGE